MLPFISPLDSAPLSYSNSALAVTDGLDDRMTTEKSRHYLQILFQWTT